MAFKAVFHGYPDPVRKQEILQAIARFRAEKAARCLKESGVTDDTIRPVLSGNWYI